MGASAESLRMSTENEDPNSKVKRPTVGGPRKKSKPILDVIVGELIKSSMCFMILELHVIDMIQCLFF